MPIKREREREREREKQLEGEEEEGNKFFNQVSSLDEIVAEKSHGKHGHKVLVWIKILVVLDEHVVQKFLTVYGAHLHSW